MNDLPRYVKLPLPPTRSRSSSAQTGRKVTIYFLAAFIVSTMILWFGFLGWGFIAMSQGLLDFAKQFWAHF
jgi:hypothetical protein